MGGGGNKAHKTQDEGIEMTNLPSHFLKSISWLSTLARWGFHAYGAIVGTLDAIIVTIVELAHAQGLL